MARHNLHRTRHHLIHPVGTGDLYIDTDAVQSQVDQVDEVLRNEINPEQATPGVTDTATPDEEDQGDEDGTGIRDLVKKIIDILPF